MEAVNNNVILIYHWEKKGLEVGRNGSQQNFIWPILSSFNI